MEYVQERITTLHDFTDPAPDAPVERATVVIPMTEREHASLAAERVLSALEAVGPERVVVALRADADRAAAMRSWLEEFELPVETLWCDGPRLASLLKNEGLNGRRGKGRDVWLALGCALDSEYVVVHDADATTYSRRHVPRLLFPLAHGHEFSKGYYARVENGRLYGRLFRLFYRPLVHALSAEHHVEVLDYLESFRYALAGEFAATRDVARSLRVQRGWGLEVGTLGDAFARAGIDGTAQVDLGRHEHDHRAVSGPSGLSTMSEQVGRALFHVVEEGGVEPNYATLPARYRTAADRLVEQYATDAAFNDFSFDAAAEREQVAAYAEAVGPPTEDSRLPAWEDAPIAPEDVRSAAIEDLQNVT